MSNDFHYRYTHLCRECADATHGFRAGRLLLLAQRFTGLWIKKRTRGLLGESRVKPVTYISLYIYQTHFYVFFFGLTLNPTYIYIYIYTYIYIYIYIYIHIHIYIYIYMDSEPGGFRFLRNGLPNCEKGESMRVLLGEGPSGQRCPVRLGDSTTSFLNDETLS